METLKRYLLTFALVLAGSTISATIFISIFAPSFQFTIMLLWEIIGMAVTCTLGNLFYVSKSEISKKQMQIRMFFHYIYILSIVLGAGVSFGWINPNYIIQFIVMFVLVTIVYISVMIVDFHKGEQTAEAMNEMLRKINRREKDE